MSLIDLSQPFKSGMFSQKLFPPIVLDRCIKFEDRGINVTTVSAGVHAGTHIDAPRHFYEKGRTIDQLALEEVAGPAVCWEVSRQAGEQILVSDLEAQSPALREGDILFLRTGWDVHFANDHERYQVHPYLSMDAAEWLLERRIKLLAIDAPTPDMPEAVRAPGRFDFPVHHLLLGNGILIAEHLAHLEEVAGRRFIAFALPVPYVGSDGAPARIVAQV